MYKKQYASYKLRLALPKVLIAELSRVRKPTETSNFREREARQSAPFYLTLRRQRGARAGEEVLTDDGGLLITPAQVLGHVEAKDKLHR